MSSRLLAYNSNDGHYEPLLLQNGTQYLYVTSPSYDAMLTDLDQIESACNDIKDNTDQIETRLYDTASGQNAGESLKLIETDIENTNTLLTAQKSVLDDMLVDTDGCVSKLTDISTNASLTASRCSNLQDWVGTSDGAGGGAKTGVNIAEILVDTDSCVSKLTTIETQSVSTASRLSNVQDWIGTSDGAGGGAKTGVNIASIDSALSNLTNRTHTICGTQANLMSGASCVAIGTTSSVIDWFLAIAVPKRVSILITATASVASSGVEVYGSADNSTYALLKTFTPTTTNLASGPINTTGGVVMDWSCRYLKIINYSLGTYTATVIGTS